MSGRADGSPALDWSVLRDGALRGSVNMARDHALALGLPDGGPGRAVLRLYRWERPTLSLGRNEPAVGRFDGAAAEERGIDVVRRPTGGRAVLHHRELTYAVVLPVRSHRGVREAYVALNRALRRGLASVGVPAEIADERDDVRAPGPDAGPCFREPAPGELVARGRKLVGSSQARIGRALLQHGSILIADDQGLVETLEVPGAAGDRSAAGGGGTEAAGSPPATLEWLLDGRVPGLAELEEAIVEGFRAELGGRWSRGAPRIDPAAEAELAAKYRSRTWTWRR